MAVVPGWRSTMAGAAVPPMFQAGLRRERGGWLSGVGASPRTSAIINAGATAGTILASGGDTGKNLILSSPSIAAGVMAQIWPALAVPVVGAAVAGVTVALTLLFNRKGPAQKVATTKIVDQVEPLLQDNLRGYMEGPRTYASQEQALQNFDAAWAYLAEKCGASVMGEPGQRCISERQRGGSAPWCPTGTGCDWFALYRDPIANDVPASSGRPGGDFADTVSSVFTDESGNLNLGPVLLGAGLLGAALLL